MNQPPWKLTKRQRQVMAALVEGGCGKLAAAHLGTSQQAISTTGRNAMRRMGQRTLLHAVLAWDRWARQQEST